MDKPQIWMTRRDVRLTPLDRIRHDVQTVITALFVEVPGEAGGETSKSATEVENVGRRCKASEVPQTSDISFRAIFQIADGAREVHGAGWRELALPAAQLVQQIHGGEIDRSQAPA